ncbi:ATP-binding protein [Streptomyces sp. BK208]|uniref:ATP-binding protein n=1 Tax=Streptomyces sp. BK208 TaxID=2512150 RepID=UPI00105C04BF|nr:ATP-binding protein [Streptomyces sp. BK208]
MRSAYVLDAEGDGCIGDARHHAVTFLDRAAREHRLPVSARTRDLTQLVVSELVTNARKYAPGPVRIALRISSRAVDVVVSDTHTAVPAARSADPRRIGQHGLEIVKAVSEELLVEREPGGKRITARISLDSARATGTSTTPA